MEQEIKLQLCIVEAPPGAADAVVEVAGAPTHDGISVLLVNDDPATLFALRAALSDLDVRQDLCGWHALEVLITRGACLPAP